MREYCLMSKGGIVVNMAMTHNPTGPTLTEWQKEQGMHWLPIQKVNKAALTAYRYWNERP